MNSARLSQILRYKRPHGSTSLDEMVDEVFASYPYETFLDDKKAPLALHIKVGTSQTLFSCHLDTVHRTPGLQIVGWDRDLALFYKQSDGDDECLGADDGAGIWLLLEMIDAGVPGHYLFHYGEERGGIGSTGMAEYHADFLKQFQRAVAFDRRGSTSVISHQGWGRCCSDTFAEVLADALNADSVLRMLPDNTGIFTDTANYVELIPECTNISCGYEAEHTKREVLDANFLSQLRDVVVILDWESLPTERIAEPAQARFSLYDPSYNDDLMGMRYSELLKWVKKNLADPEMIADVLYDAFDRVVYTAERVDEPKPWENSYSLYENYDFDPRLDVGMR